MLLTWSKTSVIHIVFFPFKNKIIIWQVGAQLISNIFIICVDGIFWILAYVNILVKPLTINCLFYRKTMIWRGDLMRK